VSRDFRRHVVGETQNSVYYRDIDLVSKSVLIRTFSETNADSVFFEKHDNFSPLRGDRIVTIDWATVASFHPRRTCL